jgi:hypothetical protein
MWCYDASRGREASGHVVFGMKTLTVGLVALLHAAVTAGAFVLWFAIGMDRADTGAEATLFERAVAVCVDVLFFPLVHLAQLAPRGWFPDLWGYVPLVLNSALWACAFVAGRSWARRARG